MIAFEVDGESMYPKFDPGDVVVVGASSADQHSPFLGQLAAVRTGDGRRYLKKLFQGTAGSVPTRELQR
jgi:phage repressor protein C with HTH and peptisase S24 domain